MQSFTKGEKEAMKENERVKERGGGAGEGGRERETASIERETERYYNLPQSVL